MVVAGATGAQPLVCTDLPVSHDNGIILRGNGPHEFDDLRDAPIPEFHIGVPPLRRRMMTPASSILERQALMACGLTSMA